MPLYRYQALSREGKKTNGVIKADSYEVAKELLKKQRMFVVKLLMYKDKKQDFTLSEEMLIGFTRDLSQLLKAGLPLYESLLAIEEKYKSHISHPLFLDLCDKVKLGKHLSEVFSTYPKIFDQIYISMVASGEETGTLSEVFLELEKLMSKQNHLKKQLVSAMIYPAFLFSFCIVVVNALFFFLIPSMQQLFEGRALHPMTETILSISLFLRKNGVFLGLSSLAVIIMLLLFFSRPQGRLLMKKSLLKVPILNKMTTQAVLARFSRALSVMLRGSVSLIDALNLSKKVMNHPCFEEVIARAQIQIMQGGKLSQELAKSPLIPSLVIRMLAISEEAGNTSEMLQNIAQIYEEELDKSLTRFTTLLQPLLLLFLAVIVGVVILSVLLPLTDVGSFLNT